MKLGDFLQDVGRPLAYYPSLAKCLGAVKATVFLCQLIYWLGKQHDEDGWIYKETQEMENETGLNREEQETARKHLIKCGVLEERYARIAHKLAFRVKMDTLNKLWEEHLQKTLKSEVIPIGEIPDSGNPRIPIGEIPEWRKDESPNRLKEAETTSEITTESKTTTAQTRARKVSSGASEHWAIAMYNKRFGHQPPADSEGLIIEVVTNQEIWQNVLDIWKGNGHEQKLVGNLIDRYKREVKQAEWQKKNQNATIGPSGSDSKRRTKRGYSGGYKEPTWREQYIKQLKVSREFQTGETLDAIEAALAVLPTITEEEWKPRLEALRWHNLEI
jgi:hypothetical protein